MACAQNAKQGFFVCVLRNCDVTEPVEHLSMCSVLSMLGLFCITDVKQSAIPGAGRGEKPIIALHLCTTVSTFG